MCLNLRGFHYVVEPFVLIKRLLVQLVRRDFKFVGVFFSGLRHFLQDEADLVWLHGVGTALNGFQFHLWQRAAGYSVGVRVMVYARTVDLSRVG